MTEPHDLTDRSRDGVFTTDVVARIDRQFASLPAYARPAVWAHAALPEYARLRSWLEDEIAALPPLARSGFVSRLLDSANHTQAVAELATGVAMRVPGYTVEFGPTLDGLTPDLLVTGPSGCQLIAEVWTRGLAHTTASRNRQWAGLAQRITRIPVGVALAADAVNPMVTPPDHHARARITAEIKRWLLSTIYQPGAVIAREGLVFRMVGTTNTGHAELRPIRESSTADRKDVVEAIERKVKKYRLLADDRALPFVVVLSTDEETALDRNHVDSILAGKNSITMTIPLGGIGHFDSGPIEIRQTEAPPVFNPVLSAVAWLDVNSGANARLHLWLMPTAARPVRLIEPAAGCFERASGDDPST